MHCHMILIQKIKHKKTTYFNIKQYLFKLKNFEIFLNKKKKLQTRVYRIFLNIMIHFLLFQKPLFDFQEQILIALQLIVEISLQHLNPLCEIISKPFFLINGITARLKGTTRKRYIRKNQPKSEAYEGADNGLLRVQTHYIIVFITNT